MYGVTLILSAACLMGAIGGASVGQPWCLLLLVPAVFFFLWGPEDDD